MNIVEFTYTKADGKVSNRVVVEVENTDEYFEGIDVTSLEPVESVMFVDAYSALLESQQLEIMTLMQEFDLKHSYRKFIKANMTNVKTEEIN